MQFIFILLTFAATVVHGRTYDDRAYVYILQSGATNNSQGLQSQSILDISVGIPPVRLSDSTFFITNTYLRREQAGYFNSKEYFTDLSPGFSLLHNWNKYWNFFVSERFSWRTNGNQKFNFGKEIFPISLFLTNYCPRGNRRYCYTFGAMADPRRSLYIPTLNVRWETLDRFFYMELGSPLTNFIIRPNEDWELGLGAEVNYPSYYIGSPETNLLPPNSQMVSFFYVLVGPKVTYGINKHLHLNIYTGASTFRTVQFLDSAGHRINGSSQSGPSTFFFRFGLSLRFDDPTLPQEHQNPVQDSSMEQTL